MPRKVISTSQSHRSSQDYSDIVLVIKKINARENLIPNHRKKNSRRYHCLNCTQHSLLIDCWCLHHHKQSLRYRGISVFSRHILMKRGTNMRTLFQLNRAQVKRMITFRVTNWTPTLFKVVRVRETFLNFCPFKIGTNPCGSQTGYTEIEHHIKVL